MVQTFDIAPGTPCDLCGMPLGDYVLQDGRGQNMCGKHERVLRGCSFCDRAFLPAGARDDRCPRCRSYAIEREVDADRRYRQIQDWFAGHRLILPRPPPLELSDRMSGDAGQLYQAGYVEFLERGFGAGALRIILRRGMPVELFLIVLVHEVSHVWLRHHYYFPDLPKTMEEGVCQWVALAFARGLATAEGQWQARRLETRDVNPLYTAGLKQFKQLATGASLSDLPNVLRSLWPTPILRAGHHL